MSGHTDIENNINPAPNFELHLDDLSHWIARELEPWHFNFSLTRSLSNLSFSLSLYHSMTGHTRNRLLQLNAWAAIFYFQSKHFRCFLLSNWIHEYSFSTCLYLYPTLLRRTYDCLSYYLLIGLHTDVKNNGTNLW